MHFIVLYFHKEDLSRLWALEQIYLVRFLRVVLITILEKLRRIKMRKPTTDIAVKT
jgi:hypothetical protein